MIQITNAMTVTNSRKTSHKIYAKSTNVMTEATNVMTDATKVMPQVKMS